MLAEIDGQVGGVAVCEFKVARVVVAVRLIDFGQLCLERRDAKARREREEVCGEWGVKKRREKW